MKRIPVVYVVANYENRFSNRRQRKIFETMTVHELPNRVTLL
jgi:hypothetical protein